MNRTHCARTWPTRSIWTSTRECVMTELPEEWLQVSCQDIANYAQAKKDITRWHERGP